MATIRDVAEHALVSVSTASRILSNSTKEKYSEETRRRVLLASAKLGYRPNFAARALASGQTRIIAAIFPRVYDTPFTALASLQIMAGIEAFCSDNGYHMLISSPRITNGELETNFIDLLASNYLDGVIIDGHFDISPIMTLIESWQIPVVVLGHYDHTYYLRSDNVAGGRLMLEHLVGLGHRRIGIIQVEDMAQRLAGVRLAALESGLAFESLPRYPGNLSEESGAAGAEALLRAHPDLTALLAFNDRMAIGALRQAQSMGYRVPDDVSVIGYDDLPRSRDLHPPLTTINHELPSWGERAMQMLLLMMQGGTPESVVIAPRLIVRGSTAPPRQQA